LRLAAGRKAVMQTHYNTVNGAYPDRTVMDLSLAASVPREATIAQLANYDLTSIGKTQTTYWGDGTQDEMCINFFYVTLP
jgi:hypothetical protein